VLADEVCQAGRQADRQVGRQADGQASSPPALPSGLEGGWPGGCRGATMIYVSCESGPVHPSACQRCWLAPHLVVVEFSEASQRHFCLG